MAGEHDRDAEDHEDAASPLASGALPLTHVQAGEAQEQVDEGNERGEQVERLAHERGEGHLQRREAVGITSLGKRGHNAEVEAVVGQEERPGGGDEGNDEAPEAAELLRDDGHEALGEGVGHAGTLEEAHEDAGREDEDDDLHGVAAVGADAGALVLEVRVVHEQGDAGANDEEHRGGQLDVGDEGAGDEPGNQDDREDQVEPEEDFDQQEELLNHQAEKIWHRYRRYQGYEREMKFKQAMYRKGFDLDATQAWLDRQDSEESFSDE